MATTSERSAPRQPPYSQECEQSVLGSLILNPNAYDQIPWLNAEAFYREQHRLLFTAIVRMIEAGRSVDMLTLSEELGADLEKAGGVAYIGALAANTPSSYNIARYGQIVRDKAILRNVIRVGAEISDMCWAGSHEPREIAEKAETMTLAILSDELGEEVDYPRLLMRSVDRAEAARTSGAAPGLRTGFCDLDAKIRGLRPGNLIVIAGRPGTGKTSLAGCIAEQVSVRQPVAFFSLEMDRDEIADRLLSLASEVPLANMRAGDLTEEQLDCMAACAVQMGKRHLLVDDRSAIGIGYLRARCRRWKRKHGLGLVIVDYLQLLRGSGDNREQEISSISRGLKSLAKELHVPVIALSQLNREIEKRPDKRPHLSDLRESGAIEQDSDLVLMLHRDDVHGDETPNNGLAQIFIRKHRNGPLGDVTLRYRAELCRFESTDEHFSAGPVSNVRSIGGFRMTKHGVDLKARASGDEEK
ncbi:MAG: replicative DNA helicase [Burkholderiales bacterium]|jgi:replicative DNA helicase